MTCQHLLQPTGRKILCSTCNGRVVLRVFGCKLHGECIPQKQVGSVRSCLGCPDRSDTDEPTIPQQQAEETTTTTQPIPQVEQSPSKVVEGHIPYISSKIKWSYGVTTVPSRRESHLPRTLVSLKGAGFDRPRLFIDGCSHRLAMQYEEEFRLPVTARDPAARTSGNWHLSLLELFTRSPACDRYAIFQDDLVMCKDVRRYLDSLTYLENSYLNLMCFMENEEPPFDLLQGFHEGCPWLKGDTAQAGRSALALVFSREAVIALLSSSHFNGRHTDTNRGWRKVDGGIVESMNKAGWREHVHHPSLVQHTGIQSSMGNHPHPLSKSFVSESYSSLELLKK